METGVSRLFVGVQDAARAVHQRAASTGKEAADHILGRAPLAAANVEPWINPNWRTAQR
jgi:endonuclease/exonuclease/phosphatase family metal-dependent hydrolase